MQSTRDSLQIHTDQEISRKIFLVHGHAEEPKQTVAAFLRSLGLEVVILHEQANQGRTIIEKFEEHSAVGFAVVLLTPDDVGASAGQPAKSHRRARQNVILELGFFIAKLGRKRVCPLYVEGVELPSDYHGLLYVPYDDGGAWRSKLVKELSAAGIEVHSENSSTMVPLMKRKLIV
jgi:predicted nucleotide-binding protein